MVLVSSPLVSWSNSRYPHFIIFYVDYLGIDNFFKKKLPKLFFVTKLFKQICMPLRICQFVRTIPKKLLFTFLNAKISKLLIFMIWIISYYLKGHWRIRSHKVAIELFFLSHTSLLIKPNSTITLQDFWQKETLT